MYFFKDGFVILAWEEASKGYFPGCFTDFIFDIWQFISLLSVSVSHLSNGDSIS